MAMVCTRGRRSAIEGGELFCFEPSGVREVAYGQVHSVLRRFEQGIILFQLLQWRTAACRWYEGLMGFDYVREGWSSRFVLQKGRQDRRVI